MRRCQGVESDAVNSETADVAQDFTAARAKITIFNYVYTIWATISKLK